MSTATKCVADVLTLGLKTNCADDTPAYSNTVETALTESEELISIAIEGVYAMCIYTAACSFECLSELRTEPATV